MVGRLQCPVKEETGNNLSFWDIWATECGKGLVIGKQSLHSNFLFACVAGEADNDKWGGRPSLVTILNKMALEP